MYFFSPLEQFEINIFWIEFLHVYINKLYIYLEKNEYFLYLYNNFSLYSILGFFLLYVFFLQINITRSLYPKNLLDLYREKLYFIFVSIILSNFDYKFWGKKYFTFLFTIFFYIFILNILGLIPYGFTNTSFPIKCMTISVSMLIGFTILGIYIQGDHFIDHFIPKGIPLALLPMLVVIEIISYISKAFSLSIRLFANMMSGHILLNILSKFVLQLTKINIIFGLIPFFIILAISCLEVGICLLQSYVFMILLSLYYNDTCKIDHKYLLFPLLENNQWELSLDRDRIFFRNNFLYYHKFIVETMRYDYEKRFFMDECTNFSTESLINLTFIKKNLKNDFISESNLLNFSFFLGEDEYLNDTYYFDPDINSLFNIYFTSFMMGYNYSLNCECDNTYFSWYGLIIYTIDYYASDIDVEEYIDFCDFERVMKKNVLFY